MTLRFSSSMSTLLLSLYRGKPGHTVSYWALNPHTRKQGQNVHTETDQVK